MSNYGYVLFWASETMGLRGGPTTTTLVDKYNP